VKLHFCVLKLIQNDLLYQVTASHFVLILARKNVTSQSDYVQHMIRNVKKYSDLIVKLHFCVLKLIQNDLLYQVALAHPN
jgi:hypothetical protein